MAVLVFAAAALLLVAGSEAASGDTTGKPVATAPPTITGTPTIGKTLTAKTGTWTSSTAITAVSYVWWRCDASSGVCATVKPASGTSYTLVAADLGHRMRVAQTVTNSAGSTTAASNGTAVVSTADGKAYATKLPEVAGDALVGAALSAKAAAWYSPTPITKTSWAWWRCDAHTGRCSVIDKASQSSYKLVDADAGHVIRAAESVTNGAGSTTAASAATEVVGPLAPVATALPTITGTARVGETLSTEGAIWRSTLALTSVTYAWWRCDAKSGACATIPGVTGTTYRLANVDAGYTIRVVQKVANARGSASSASKSTPVVTFGTDAIAASSVSLPQRLVISGVTFSPRLLHSRGTFTAAFRITDTAGRPVSGALVYALGLPYSWVRRGIEVATGSDGWARIPITPSRRMPLGRGHALVMFVRARVPGQSLLGGSSARRLVQVRIG